MKEGVDIRLIDMANIDGELDMSDRRTFAFVKNHVSKNIDDKTYISTREPEGVRLRNLWMAEHLLEILEQTDVVIFSVGAHHLGGNNDEVNTKEYEQSLHALFSGTADGKVRFLSVFEEYPGIVMFKNIAPHGQTAMSSPDTFIMRSQNKDWIFDFEEEIKVMKKMSDASNIPEAASPIESEEDLRLQLAKNKQTLKEELDNIIHLYSPVRSHTPTPF